MVVKKEMDLVPVTQWNIFPNGQKPIMIAGPCSAESLEQVLETAQALKNVGINVYRAGIWKPRTHPNQFEGLGTPGLAMLAKVKEQIGMKICTEVACKEHFQECLEYGVDMVWIGARTTANPFLVQEIADFAGKYAPQIPILVKNPPSMDLDLWLGALERLNLAGIQKLGVVLRGFAPWTVRDSIKDYRNEPGWRMAVEMRSRLPELPFLCDPSHIAGRREYVQEISQRAMDLGLDGLMVESHINPKVALSDAAQQLTPANLNKMLLSLSTKNLDSDSAEYRENIDLLRERIDIIDEELLKLLKERMAACREIGLYKREHNIAILQTSRWESLMEQIFTKAEDSNLSENFIRRVFDAIHEESVRIQEEQQ